VTDDPAAVTARPAWPGRNLVVWAWVANFAVAVTSIPVALGAKDLEPIAAGICVAVLILSIVVWGWAFFKSLARTTRDEDINVGDLFILRASAPKPVRWNLYGALVVSLVIAVATAIQNPATTLVPLLPLAYMGLWNAKYQKYPKRRVIKRR
jgi:hypothetical protein